jgi:hypothetical protein
MENQVDIGAFAVENEEMMGERRQGGDKASMSLKIMGVCEDLLTPSLGGVGKITCAT